MKLLLDTNILVAAVTVDTDRSEVAIELLNEAEGTYVSVLNLMEPSTAQNPRPMCSESRPMPQTEWNEPDSRLGERNC